MSIFIYTTEYICTNAYMYTKPVVAIINGYTYVNK